MRTYNQNYYIQKLEDRDIQWLNNQSEHIAYNDKFVTIANLNITYDSVIEIAKKMELSIIKWVQSKHAYKCNNQWANDIHDHIWLCVIRGGL